MRCMLLHRRRGSARGYGPAAAPWPEKLRRGQWKQGMCKGWGQGPRQRPAPSPQGNCSERLTQEETSADAAKISRSGSAPEMKKPLAEPVKKHQCTCVNKRAEHLYSMLLSLFALDDYKILL